MNDFWIPNTQMNEKEPAEPLKFEEFDFDQLLSKYGPDGLWELSDKLREIALNDAEASRIARWTDDDACYS